jgi:hypothetical protein
MQLKYHQATYDLLTQSRIDQQKAIDERNREEATLIQIYADGGQDAEKMQQLKEESKWRLAWTQLDLYQRPVRFSEKNTQSLDELEEIRREDSGIGAGVVQPRHCT